MKKTLLEMFAAARSFVLREENRVRARALTEEVNRAFTQHPHDTGETYWQHLWFTSTMSLRLLYAMAVLLIHGIFPFLLTRAASSEIEQIYRIMKGRIPKNRLDAIDADDIDDRRYTG